MTSHHFSFAILDNHSEIDCIYCMFIFKSITHCTTSLDLSSKHGPNRHFPLQIDCCFACFAPSSVAKTLVPSAGPSFAWSSRLQNRRLSVSLCVCVCQVLVV